MPWRGSRCAMPLMSWPILRTPGSSSSGLQPRDRRSRRQRTRLARSLTLPACGRGRLRREVRGRSSPGSVSACSARGARAGHRRPAPAPSASAMPQNSGRVAGDARSAPPRSRPRPPAAAASIQWSSPSTRIDQRVGARRRERRDLRDDRLARPGCRRWRGDRQPPLDARLQRAQLHLIEKREQLFRVVRLDPQRRQAGRAAARRRRA